MSPIWAKIYRRLRPSSRPRSSCQNVPLNHASQIRPKMMVNRERRPSQGGACRLADHHDVNEVVEQLEEADLAAVFDVAVGTRRRAEPAAESPSHTNSFGVTIAQLIAHVAVSSSPLLRSRIG